MGTRGMLAFVIKGKIRGSYNQWDSYPTGMGLAIMRFLRSLSEEDIERMIKNLEKIEWVNREEGDKPSKELQDRYIAADFCQTHSGRWAIRSGTPEDWYNLLYKTRMGRCLPFILDGTLGHLCDDDDWDEEWVYVIDMEKRTLRIEGNAVTDTASFQDLGLEYAMKLEHPDKTENELAEEVAKWKEKEALRTKNYTIPDPNFYGEF